MSRDRWTWFRFSFHDELKKTYHRKWILSTSRGECIVLGKLVANFTSVQRIRFFTSWKILFNCKVYECQKSRVLHFHLPFISAHFSRNTEASLLVCELSKINANSLRRICQIMNFNSDRPSLDSLQIAPLFNDSKSFKAIKLQSTSVNKWWMNGLWN